jgi:lysophospholipase L1-like esterase
MTNIVKLLHWARTDFPGIRLYLVEAHPHPSQKNPSLPDKWNGNLHRKNRFNEMLAMYAQCHPDTKIITLWDKPGFFETPEDVGNFRKVRDDLFAPDKVHLNQAGYDVLAPIIREALDDIL